MMKNLESGILKPEIGPDLTSHKEDGRPSFPFYPRDWSSDKGLKLCSLSARGLWFECLCLAWDSPRRGYVLVGDIAPSISDLARLFGSNPRTVKAGMKELEQHKVFSTTTDGIIYSRRMVRDEMTHKAKMEAGSLGGMASKHPSKGQASLQADPKAKLKQKGPFSSSISSSSSKEIKDTSRSNRDDSLLKIAAEGIFDYWISKLGGRWNLATWRANIQARLKTFSMADIKLAIDRLASSDWHAEHGERQMKNVFSSDKRIEFWLQKEPKCAARDAPRPFVPPPPLSDEQLKKNQAAYQEGLKNAGPIGARILEKIMKKSGQQGGSDPIGTAR